MRLDDLMAQVPLDEIKVTRCIDCGKNGHWGGDPECTKPKQHHAKGKSKTSVARPPFGARATDPISRAAAANGGRHEVAGVKRARKGGFLVKASMATFMTMCPQDGGEACLSAPRKDLK